jgi:hypothetical protein
MRLDVLEIPDILSRVFLEETRPCRESGFDSRSMPTFKAIMYRLVLATDLIRDCTIKITAGRSCIACSVEKLAVERGRVCL